MHTTHPTFRRAGTALVVGALLALASCGGDSDTPAPNPPAPPGPPPPAAQTVFPPSADDLPRVAGLYPYPEPSLAQIQVTYVPTPVSGPGLYLTADGRCRQLGAPPADTYPGGLVTLDTVNLDTNKTDDCKPEIQVLVSGDGFSSVKAKLRQRGTTSRLVPQKSYRIKFKDAKPWHGEAMLQLNKHPYDLARVRNKLAFDLMRDTIDHASLRTQFVQLSYTDAGGTTRDMGLFTHVERVDDDDYMARRQLIAGSNLYKAQNFSFNPDESGSLAVNADGTAGPDFEKVLSIESDSKNHAAIVNLVDALDRGDMAFKTLFSQHFSQNNYLAWLSTIILLGNYDTIAQNFYLYQPLGTERFYFLPWDYDDALGTQQQPGTTPDPGWALGIGNWWGSVLHRGFLLQPGNVDLLVAAVQEIRDKYLTDATVKARLDGYRALVEPLITRPPDVTGLPLGPSPSAGSPATQWAAEYARLYTVIGANHRHFLDSLERPMPFLIQASPKAGKTVFDWSWPLPHHLRGKAFSYSFKLARSVPGQAPFAPATLVESASGLQVPIREVSNPASGNYLVQIVATDTDGRQTPAFNAHYTDDGAMLPGVLCVSLPSAHPCS